MFGNHDAYYKNTNQTNSLDFLRLISQNNNITIINNDPYSISINNKNLILFPWASEINYLFDENGNKKEIEKYDYAFGHFEANGFEQNGQSSMGNRLNNSDLFNIADYLFSGHYHNNKIYYDMLTNTPKLQMVGSTMQLNWGEYNQNKFIYTLDLNTNEINSFKNNVNSKYEKIYYSKLSKNEYSTEELNKLCNKNYIKLVIDMKYEYNTILNFTEKLRTFKPNSIELDYLISLTNDIIAESSTDMVKSSTKDNYTYTIDYIKQIFPDISKIKEDVTLDYLLELQQGYYKKAQLSKEEREEKELE